MSYDFGALQNNRYSLRTFINATKILWAEEITIAANGNKTRKGIYNIAGFTAGYGVEYNNRKGIDVRLSGRYTGHRKDTDFNDPLAPEIVYPEFMVLDFYAGYTYAQKHTLGLFVNNITDENYYEKRGYNMPGRNISVRYSITF